jgi:Rrf2 family transcriptional regulator, iron-sulfur cluster assembly transcription factor
VRSVRGPGGGYHLGRDASEISVAQVIEAVNETTDATRCKGQGDCQGGETCLTHHLWTDLSDQIRAFLHDISLADLVARRDIQAVSQRQQARAAADEASDIELLSVSQSDEPAEEASH